MKWFLLLLVLLFSFYPLHILNKYIHTYMCECVRMYIYPLLRTSKLVQKLKAKSFFLKFTIDLEKQKQISNFQYQIRTKSKIKKKHFPRQKKKKEKRKWDRKGEKKEKRLTGFLGFAFGPLWDGEVDLLAGESFGPVGLLETVPHQIGADVGVRYVCHPCRSPKWHCCCHRHLLLLLSVFVLSKSKT